MRRGLIIVMLAAVVAAGGTVSAVHAASPSAFPAGLSSFQLQLHDDDTAELVPGGTNRQLLTTVHQLLAAGRVSAVVRLIPKPYKRTERALLHHAKWRHRALLLMSTHPNADRPSVVYPGFVHRCASDSDYSKWDISSLELLGQKVARKHPCTSMLSYHGAILLVGHDRQPRSGREVPYFRGLVVRHHH